jgi:hypothetical protein
MQLLAQASLSIHWHRVIATVDTVEFNNNVFLGLLLNDVEKMSDQELY